MMKHYQHNSPSNRRGKRQGSLYVSVVMVGAIVSILGLSAMLVARINTKSQQGLLDSATARLNAQAALRLGMLTIENDPNWRFRHSTSQWILEQPLGDGVLSLEVTDPSDNDISDAAADPVILTGIGRQGKAIHKTQITLAPLHRGYNCLASAIHSNDDVIFDNAWASCDHVASANDDIKSYNSYVSLPVEAADVVTGSYYYNTYQAGVATRSMPTAAEVRTFYEDNGTWIDRDTLPQHFAEMVRNGDMESGDSFWDSQDSTIVADQTTAHSGNQSLLVTNRADEYAGVTQDISKLVTSGRTYEVDFAARLPAGATSLFVHIEIDDANGPDDHVAGPFTPTANNQWEQFSLTIQPWFARPLTSVKLVINTTPFGGGYGGSSGTSNAIDFMIDDVTMKEQGTTRCMDQVLLSPDHNPFGTTNDRGIYLIDMKGSKLIVKNSRIHGTLVIIDPASSTALGDEAALSMSAAEPSLPTLIVLDQEILINPSEQGLVEDAVQVNFNPAGAAYPSVGSDDDMTDTFPSSIQGMIYSENHLRLYNLSIHGAIVAHGDVDIHETFSMTYDSRFYRNPPPGFSGPEQIRLLLGSAKRITE